ncbi:KCNB2 [Symbiodinium natans]|uniref:KCNB2 protein n=1 Tax=Symbiodinium natans TaxID=878477 RepID=A0A812LVJ1_9DINO|nr:KCNB2 [Symbiodinium natans]
MSHPAEGSQKVQVEHSAETSIFLRSFADIEARLDELSDQVNACLQELLGLKRSARPSRFKQRERGSHRHRDSVLPVIPSGRPSTEAEPACLLHTQTLGQRPSRRQLGSSLSSFASNSTVSEESRGHSRMSTMSNPVSLRNEMVSFKEDGKPQVLEYTPSEWKDNRRRANPVRKVDLKIAWQIHAKELKKQAAADEETRPIMRLIYRSRCDHLWEMLDDPDSSCSAWAVSQFLKGLVLVSLILSLLVTAQEPLLDVTTSAVLETGFDAIFLMEFLCRCVSSPSKRIYVRDPFSWCDMLAALGLPLRASAGFVLQPLSSLEAPSVQQVLLLLFVPILRFLKLIRYFESFHLLVDAGKNSIAALPVLFYTMAVITLVSSSAIYLAESRDNIPSLPHSIWLALVTMTTVGYGDYAPKSTGGYFVVATLTGVSMLFLALPVGIIGHVFTACWESRAQVLLMNRVRKCLIKWGYTIKDLKILVEYVDADGDGTLNLPEFIELIRQMRIGLSSASWPQGP